MSQEDRPKGINILCIDGGGVRGLSSLILLSEIMNRLQGLDNIDQPSKPTDYFDIIAGTGTGGVIACMLGRLRMPVDEAIRAYAKLAGEVFSGKNRMGSWDGTMYKGTALREALKTIVRDATRDEDERMRERVMDRDGCKTMAFAMSKHNMNASIPIMFRSYPVWANPGPDCTIWEAMYATMALPEFFEPIEIIDGGIGQSFVGGELGCSNPISRVLAEVKNLYPGRHVSCVLSIGAGHACTIRIPDPGISESVFRTGQFMAMRDLATDSERVAQDMAGRFQDTTGVYYRFNVDQGMQSIEPGEWERLCEVKAHTRAYIGMFDTNRGMDQAVRAIKERNATIPIVHLDGTIRVPVLAQGSTIKRCPAPTSVYTGRKDLIHQVGTCITGGGDERRVCVIRGLGGAGKTQLALKTIDLNRDSWKHVLYTDASSRQAVESTLQDFAKAMGIGGTHHEALTWLGSCREPWLVVFDNADDPSLKIHEFFPGGNHGSILITSRLADMKIHAQGPGSDCHISGMNYEDALALLLRLARKTDQELSVTERTAANSLLQDLGCLALAVVHAGAYIGHSHMSVAKYRELFLISRQPTLERYDKLKVKVDDYRKSVYTTWKMCYDLLPENGDSRPLLWLMAYLHHNDIAEDVFEQAAIKIRSYKPLIPPTSVEAAANNYLRDYLGRFLGSDGNWGSLVFSDAINELASYSLIDFDQANRVYNIHVLVQEWIRTVIPQSHDLALECTTMLLARSIDYRGSVQTHIFKHRISLHVSRVLAEQHFKPGANHASEFASVYNAQGNWDMEAMLEYQAQETRLQLLGKDHPATLTSMNNLATAYLNQGRWDMAESMQLQVLDLRKRILGNEHPDTLIIMGNLALTYQNQGRWDMAESMQLQVLDLCKRILGNEHPDTLTSMNTLASTYQKQGRWDMAESMQLQVLDLCKRILGHEHPHTLISMGNLALTYQKQGRWDMAQSMQLQVLDLCKRILGNEHPHTLINMSNLALTYQNQGRWDMAESMQLQVLDLRKRILGNEHPDTLIIMGNLALTYQNQGRWDMAESMQLQVLDLCKRILGNEHPDTLTSMNTLASTYQKQGRWDMAESMQLQVLDLRKRILGHEHPHTLISMGNLALTYQKQGRWDMAQSMQLQVLDLCKRILGNEHPHTLISMGNLALTYQKQGRWDMAQSMQLQVLDLCKRILGNEHPHTLNSMNTLASTYQKQGRWDMAESMQLQVLDLRKRILGNEHPDTLCSMHNLALTYQKQGRWDMAESMQLQALDVCNRVLGQMHPHTLACIQRLAWTYHKQAQWHAEEAVLTRLVYARAQVFGQLHPCVLHIQHHLELARSKRHAAEPAASSFDSYEAIA